MLSIHRTKPKQNRKPAVKIACSSGSTQMDIGHMMSFKNSFDCLMVSGIAICICINTGGTGISIML